MSRVSDQHTAKDLDDCEGLLADKPRDETWELIGGRVVAGFARRVPEGLSSVLDLAVIGVGMPVLGIDWDVLAA